jgi:hypothetical protein
MHLHAASMAEVRMMDGAEPVSSDQLSVIGMAGGASITVLSYEA